MGTFNHPLDKKLPTDALNMNTMNTQDTMKGGHHPHNENYHDNDHHHRHCPSDDNIRYSGGVRMVGGDNITWPREPLPLTHPIPHHLPPYLSSLVYLVVFTRRQ